MMMLLTKNALLIMMLQLLKQKPHWLKKLRLMMHFKHKLWLKKLLRLKRRDKNRLLRKLPLTN